MNWKELFYNRTLRYLGKNGVGKQIGVEVFYNEAENCIMLSPINSKGNITEACFLNIPVELLPDILQFALNQHDKKSKQTVK